MKQNLIYLLKGLLFATVILTLSTLFLAFLMMKTGWGDAVMYPMLIAFFCLSAFIGGPYFAKHAQSRRFLWGTLFGAAFFVLYAIVTYFLSPEVALLSENAITYLITSLAAGCVGGMLS
jgi:putative membrane protein (TIGR04086 family)